MDTRRARGSPAEPTGGSLTPSTVFRYKQRHPLHALFAPRSIVVVGATEKAGSVGRTLFWNLISNPFGGMVFPVNPKRASVLGIKAYPTLAAVPERVDLAVIATPAPTVPGIITECVEAGVKGAIIISAGFKESGAEGAELEQQIRERARQGKLRVMGPNCLGVMNPLNGQHEIIGVGSLIEEHSTKNAEIALLVADQFQRQGLGTELLRRLIEVGRDEQLQRLTGDILAENQGMQEICKKLGFHLQYSLEEQVVKVELELIAWGNAWMCCCLALVLLPSLAFLFSGL